MSLAGKVTLITGGGKNLGATIATLFAADGSHLALHYNSASSKKSAEALAASLSSRHENITVKTYQGDLTEVANVVALFDAVAADFGGKKLDVVINTVGMVLKKPLADISEREYDRLFAVNTKAAFFITQEAARRVAEGGQIINTVTSLLAAYTGLYTGYQGSKAPVEFFTKGLSKELMPKRISVNAIAPGPMDTPFFYGQETPEAVAFHKSNAIAGRLTSVDDIAPIFKFLCTEGTWINGQTIFANGGYTSR
jgi:NAD(P)-dependent dehydrogenase (short-subunit alcohol dehydrogenase family)